MNFAALVVVGGGDGVVELRHGQRAKGVSHGGGEGVRARRRSLVYIERFTRTPPSSTRRRRSTARPRSRSTRGQGGRLGLPRCNQIVESICESECDHVSVRPTRYAPKLRARFAA